MPTVEELWLDGLLRAATDQSAVELAACGDPFRDGFPDAAKLHAHGTRCWHLARFDEAERALERAYDLRAQEVGPDHPDTLATLERLAGLAAYQLRHELATQRYESVLERLRAIEGRHGVRVAIASRNYGSFLRERGDFRAARELVDVAVTDFRRFGVADDDLEYLALRKADAMLARAEGRLAAAVDIVHDAVERTSLAADHPFVTAAHLIRVRCLLRATASSAAVPVIEAVVESFERGYGLHPLTAIAHHQAAEATAATDLSRAAAHARTAYEMYRAVYPAPNRTTARLREYAAGLADRLHA